MDTNRIPKQALQYKSKGRRNIGRPRKGWRDNFILRIKELETHLILREHDDYNDDDDESDHRVILIHEGEWRYFWGGLGKPRNISVPTEQVEIRTSCVLNRIVEDMEQKYDKYLPEK
jgi:hypothetical protein